MIENLPARYVVRAKCGSGRFSTVYRAWDNELQRDVALKVSATTDRSAVERSRIRRECRISCKLRHPAIASGFDAFQREQYEVLCLPLLTGGTLLDTDAKRNANARMMIEQFIKICDAISYMHSSGLVHGDVKPENVLLDDHDRPYLTDFGSCQLAKQPDEDIVGTPAYLAPELARGEGGVTVKSDIYALGATLFEMLCGRPPFAGEAHAVLDQIRTQTFPVPRKINQRLDGSLDAIIVKACAAEPSDRYATAAELRTDLSNYVADRPLVAKKPSAITSALLWRRRNPMLTALAATLVAMFVLGTAVAAAGWWRSEANQRALAAAESLLREKAGIAKQRENELEKLLASMQLEQEAITLASNKEEELTRRAEAARVEIDDKSSIAQQQLAEAKRLNARILEMQIEQERVSSAVVVANRALSMSQAFATKALERRDDIMRLTKTVKKLPSGVGSDAIEKQIWLNIDSTCKLIPENRRGLGWRYVAKSASLQTTQLSVPILDLARDAIRVISNRDSSNLLFLRQRRLAELKSLNSEGQWTSLDLDLRKIAGLPRIEGELELGCFNAPSSIVVVSFASSTANHDLMLLAADGPNVGSLISRVQVPFEGIVHTIRYAANGRLYLLRSNRATNDLELYSVIEQRVVWSCRLSRKTSSGDTAPLLPFFIQCGSDPWEHMLFASSPTPPKLDAKTSVFLHSIDLRKVPAVTTFACGEQTLAEWPHEWQLSEYHILGIGKQSLSTQDPPTINHRRFDVGTTLATQPIQAFTNEWSPLSHEPAKSTPSEFLEADLFLPAGDPEHRITWTLDFAPFFDRIAGKILYACGAPCYYDIFEQHLIELPHQLSHGIGNHVIASSEGSCLLGLDDHSVRIIRIADWDPKFYQSVDEINLGLAKLERRCKIEETQFSLLSPEVPSAPVDTNELIENESSPNSLPPLESLKWSPIFVPRSTSH